MLSEFLGLFRTLQQTGELDMLYLLVIVFSFAVLIFVCLPFHEFAHAFAAHKLGDDTAKWNGRLTLNPLKHLDTFGTLMLVLCGVGYARPVPINPYNFRNPKKGMALSALAGPLSNLLMAIVGVALFRVITLLCGAEWRDGGLYVMPQYVDILWYSELFLVHIFSSINLGLAVFNLLPIPPLDGSRIFAAILPDKWAYAISRYEQYIMIGLFVLLLTGALDVPLTYLRHGFGFVVCGLFGMPNVF